MPLLEQIRIVENTDEKNGTQVANDLNYQQLSKKINSLNWQSGNSFADNELDDQEIIFQVKSLSDFSYLNDLTEQETLEASQYAYDLINNIRSELGLADKVGKLKITQKMIDFAKAVAQGYTHDG